MKKNYMKPTIEVLKMISTPILADSLPIFGGDGDEEADGALSREFEFSI